VKYTRLVRNVRPAGHIRTATSCRVARNVQQEKRLSNSRPTLTLSLPLMSQN